MHHTRRTSRTLLALTLFAALPGRAWTVPPPGEHPRLVFGSREVPALRAKLETSHGQRLFATVRAYADNSVLAPGGLVEKHKAELRAKLAEAETKGESLKAAQHGPCSEALGAAENAALVYAVTGEEKYGRAAADALDTFLPYATAEALRPAALLYDWCYPALSEAQRTRARNQIGRLADSTQKELLQQAFSLGPCPINQAIYWGMLTAGYLGIGALAIEGEPGYKPEWRDHAERCLVKSLNRFLDEEGYHENGPAYVDYGFSNACFYLEAMRLRGMDFARHPRLSKMPEWLLYLFLPGAHGVAPQLLPVGNSNFGNATGQDGFCWLRHAMPKNAAMQTVYRHVMAPANNNEYIRTVGALFLWDEPAGPGVDFAELPRARWFPDGGVFVRTGWDWQDIAFWLKTQQHRCTTGKHDDYGSFYLHAYGEPFAVEGMGKVESSAAHNLVFIDGRALDRASYDVMPSAPLVELVDAPFAVAAVVDQKEAYSEDIFFAGPERKLISKPLNPVKKAYRAAAFVRAGTNTPPYILIADDIEKDDQPHQYRWQMLVNPNHEPTQKQGFLTLSREKLAAESFYPPAMDCALLSPGSKLQHVAEPKTAKPAARLEAVIDAVNPHFTVCLYPRRPGQPTVWGMPDLRPEPVAAEGGHAAILRWPECVDRIVVSYGGTVRAVGLESDARLAVVRTELPAAGSAEPYGRVIGVLFVQGTRLTAGGKDVVTARAVPVSCAGSVIQRQPAIGRNTPAKALRWTQPW